MIDEQEELNALIEEDGQSSERSIYEEENKYEQVIQEKDHENALLKKEN